MLGYFVENISHPVFLNRQIVKEGISLGHLTEGEHIGIGFPFIHNVYRVSKDGGLNFVYHFCITQLGDYYS